MASAGSGLNVGPNAAGAGGAAGGGGEKERDPFASPDRKKPKSDLPVPPSARSNKTTGTRYSDAVSVRLNFKPSPSRPGDKRTHFSFEYLAPEQLKNTEFQSQSPEMRLMKEADNKLAMLLFDTDFQKKLLGGNAEAKAYLENLERLKRGEFRNGDFPKVKALEPREFLDLAPVGPPPPLASLRIKKPPPSLINEEEEKPETQPKKRKSRKTRKSKKTRKSRTRKH